MKMRNILTFLFGILLVSQTFSQSRSSGLAFETVYSDLQTASEKPLEVKKLNLSHNGLDSLPLTVKEFENLEILILSNNYLTDLPVWFSELNNLKYLYLDNNSFSIFPNILFSMTNLIEIDISDNNLTNISSEIKNLLTLCKLNISNNNINFKKIPKIQQYIKNCNIKH